MRDEIDGRLWVEHGHQFSEDMDRLFSGFKLTFKRMAAIQFEAPWRKMAPAQVSEAARVPRLKLAGLALGAALATFTAALAMSGAVATAGAAMV